MNFNLRLSRSLIDTLRPSFPIITGLYSEEPYLEIPSTALFSIDPRYSLFVEAEPRPVEVDLFLMVDVLKLRAGLLVITQSFAWSSSFLAERVCRLFLLVCSCLEEDFLFYLERERLTFSLVVRR